MVILLPLPPQCWDHRYMPSSVFDNLSNIVWKWGLGIFRLWFLYLSGICIYKTDLDVFLWPTASDFPKLFLGVLEFHQSSRSVFEFFLSGDYVTGRAFLSRRRSFCRTAALLVWDCSIRFRANPDAHLQWAVEPLDQDARAAGWDPVWPLSSVIAFVWWWSLEKKYFKVFSVSNISFRWL